MLKMTTVEMDWTDTGARVFSSLALPCPCCQIVVTPDVEHRCGDRAPQPAKKRPAKLLKGGA